MVAQTWYAPKITAGHPARAGLGVEIAWDVFTVSEAVEASDIFQMVAVAKGATVIDLLFAASDLDTHMTPTLTFDIGDDGDVDRFVDGTTIGSSAGHCKLGQGITTTSYQGYTYTADNTVDAKAATAPATGAASGTLFLSVTFSHQA